MRSLTQLDLQYAHRFYGFFYGFKGETCHGLFRLPPGGDKGDDDRRGMIKNTCDLLKDKLNIVKSTFTSSVHHASEEYIPHLEVARCPLCGLH